MRKKSSWLDGLRKTFPTGKNASKSVRIISDNPENMAIITVSKSIVHKKGLKHHAVYLVCLKGEKVLLQRRGKGKSNWPEYWDFIGEHILPWHSKEKEAAKNLCKVELGKNWSEPRYEFTVEEQLDYPEENPIKRDNEIRHIYVIKRNDLDVEALNSELEKNNEKIKEEKRETIGYKWVSKEEFDELLSKNQMVPYIYLRDSKNFKTFEELFKALAKEYKTPDTER